MVLLRLLICRGFVRRVTVNLVRAVRKLLLRTAKFVRSMGFRSLAPFLRMKRLLTLLLTLVFLPLTLPLRSWLIWLKFLALMIVLAFRKKGSRWIPLLRIVMTLTQNRWLLLGSRYTTKKFNMKSGTPSVSVTSASVVTGVRPPRDCLLLLVGLVGFLKGVA